MAMKWFKNRYVLLTILPLILSCSDSFDRVIDVSEESSESGSIVLGLANLYFTEEMAEFVESLDGENPKETEESVGFGELMQSLNVKSIKRIFQDGGEFEQRRRNAGLHRWYQVQYAESIPLTKAQEGFGGIDGILSVEPVYEIRQENTVFNDPELGKQWHYANDGSLSQNHTTGADINVKGVWERYTGGNRRVVVAVVDGGIDREHEDLKDNYIGGKNFVTGGQVTAEEHGTHVAGTIAARNNNGTGVCGIAGGNAGSGADGVGLLSCQIFAGKKSADGAEAIVWAADNGAVIVNNSWGYDFETREDAKKSKISGPLKAAVDYFVEYAGCDMDGNQKPDSPMKGGLVVFAAGNDGWDVNPICQYEPVFSVGAIGPDFKRSSYSNYGSWVDIAAPGGEQSTRNNTLILSTLPGNKYGWLQGTSMACPHVSGVAALVVSHFGGNGFTVEMLQKRLLEGARYGALPTNAQIGPLVDALGAFSIDKTNPPAAPDEIEVSAVGNRINASFNVTASPDGDPAFGYILLASKSKSAIENFKNPEDIPSDILHSHILVGDRKEGEAITASLGNLEFDKEYHIGVIAYDYVRNYSEISNISSVRTGENTPPIINCLSDKTVFVLKSHESLSIKFEIYDPEGETTTVNFIKGSSASSFEKTDERHWNLNINARMDKAGKYADVISVSDPFGMTATYTFEYEILVNHTPEVYKSIDNIYLESKSGEYSINLNDFFYDSDGEKLSYAVEGGNKNIASAELSGTVLKIKVVGYGLCKFDVFARDARNAVCSQEFSIMSKNPDNFVETYPVPVKDRLTVRTGRPAETHISVTTLSGAIVYESLSTVGAFEPKIIDLSGNPPGRYRVSLTIEGKKFERIITKI